MSQPKWSKKAFYAIKILPPKNCPPKIFGWCPPPPPRNPTLDTPLRGAGAPLKAPCILANSKRLELEKLVLSSAA